MSHPLSLPFLSLSLYSYLADTDSLSESDCEDLLEEDMQFDFATWDLRPLPLPILSAHAYTQHYSCTTDRLPTIAPSTVTSCILYHRLVCLWNPHIFIPPLTTHPPWSITKLPPLVLILHKHQGCCMMEAARGLDAFPSLVVGPRTLMHYNRRFTHINVLQQEVHVLQQEVVGQWIFLYTGFVTSSSSPSSIPRRKLLSHDHLRRCCVYTCS